jgi:rod shape-determining protein MreC
LFCSFTLNKGSSNDVSVNDPVLYGKYLVGVVSSVSATQCKVSSVLNPQVSASAYEVRSRESGFVETTAELSEQGLLRLPGLLRTTAISPGGIVCTSGTGGIYPRDLIIGTVREVISGSQGISSYAVIEPGVDFKQLQDVFILVDFIGQSSAEDDG